MKLTLRALKTNKIKSYIFLLVLIIFSINIINLITNYTDSKLNNDIINKKESRTLHIASENTSDMYKKIKALPNIEEVYYDTQPFLASTNIFGNIYFKNLNPLKKIKIKDGKMPQNGYQVLIPEKLLKKYNIKDNNIINKKMTITIGNNQYELIVSGVYFSENQEEYLYISNNSIVNELIKDKDYIAIANSRKNFNKIERRLQKIDCYIKFTDDSIEREFQIYQDIGNILNKFSILCYVILVIVLLIIIFYNITEKNYNIALLKVIGYSNFTIIKTLMLEFICILLISFILTVGLLQVIEFFLVYIFSLSNFINYAIIASDYFIIFLLTMMQYRDLQLHGVQVESLVL